MTRVPTHVLRSTLRNHIPLPLYQYAILINPDLVGREPNLDPEFPDPRRELRRCLIRPFLQDHVSVGAVPQDRIRLLMRDGDLPELRQREEIEAGLRRAVWQGGLGDVVDEGEGREERQPHPFQTGVAVVRRVDAAHRAVVVRGAVRGLVYIRESRGDGGIVRLNELTMVIGFASKEEIILTWDINHGTSARN